MLVIALIGILCSMVGTIWCGYYNKEEEIPLVCLLSAMWIVTFPVMALLFLFNNLYKFGKALYSFKRN